MRHGKKQVVLGVVLIATGCTHAPPEQRAHLSSYARVPDTYRAVFTVEHERFRRPTGIVNTFPNGGVLRMLDQNLVIHVGDIRTRDVDELLRMPVPDSVWVSFSATIVGVDDRAVFAAIAGCPRDSRECYGSLMKRWTVRVDFETGEVTWVSEVPAPSRLRGTMLARRPDEQVYMRLGRRHGALSARTEPEAEFRPVFRVDSVGGAHPVSGEP